MVNNLLIEKKISKNWIKESFKLFNWKLFLTLILTSLIPAIYSTTRIFWLGEMDDPYAYSIAAQIQWLNIFYEIINEAILVPLFFLISRRKDIKLILDNRIKSGLLINIGIYLIYTIIVFVSLNWLASLMITDPNLLNRSLNYMYLETTSLFFFSIVQYSIVIFIILKKHFIVGLIFLAQALLIIFFDTFFISNLHFSLKLSVEGVGISNIITNIFLSVFIIFLFLRIRIKIWSLKGLNFEWAYSYWKIGFFSGLESLIRNLFFVFMVLKILNGISAAGDYWLANGFIWTWMLLPIISLSNVIKSEGDKTKNNLMKYLFIYALVTLGIIFIWLVTIPSYELFIHNILNVKNSELVTNIVLMLLPFYICFALNNIINSMIIGWGRSDITLYQSILVNILVYIPYFSALMSNIWVPDVMQIAIMFGMTMLTGFILNTIIFVIITRTKINFILKTKNKKVKNIYFGMPTVGKTYFSQNNNVFDSECIYSLNSELNKEKWNSFKEDPKLSRKLINISFKKLIKSDYEYIFFSILPNELIEKIDSLILDGHNINYILREPVSYAEEWNKRKSETEITLTKEMAESSFEYSYNQAKDFNIEPIILEQNQYLSGFIKNYQEK